MGKRRVRCLKSLGIDVNSIYGMDLREDRRKEAEEKYEITTYSDFDDAFNKTSPTAIIISVPPDKHHIYMKKAIDLGVHFFVEASVTDEDMDIIIEKLKNSNIVAAPSLTLHFHPAIEKIKQIVESGELGSLSNFVHHSGQYLPDWHTYEKVSDYYVSNPLTGGGREIVPFEFGWLAEVFGFPTKVAANVRKTIEIEGAEKIDDTFNILFDYEKFLGVLIVDVVSRNPVRRLMINGKNKQLMWDWNDDFIQIYDPAMQEWNKISYEVSKAAEGYHANIGEGMYINEIAAFIKAIENNGPFVNTMENDHKILKTLYAAEKSQKEERFIKLEF